MSEQFREAFHCLGGAFTLAEGGNTEIALALASESAARGHNHACLFEAEVKKCPGIHTVRSGCPYVRGVVPSDCLQTEFAESCAHQGCVSEVIVDGLACLAFSLLAVNCGGAALADV